MEHRYYFDSLDAMLGAVEATRNPLNEYYPCGAKGSTDQDTRFYGRPLSQMVEDCRKMTPFSKDILTVERMVEGLTTSLPPPRSVKRRRVRRDEGDHPDIDRMLAGDLEHAWITTRRVLHDDPTALTTVIIPMGYPAGILQTSIFWSMAATLGLAWLLEQSGRRTCLASVKYSQLLGSSGVFACTTILKHFSEPWSIQEAICTTDRAFLRRLHFRLMDSLQRPPDLSYCYDLSLNETRHYYQTCARDYGWGQVIKGAHPSNDDIDDQASAHAWITNQLTALEAVAV